MFAGISFHLPENVLGHFLTCRSADSNFFLSFHLLKNLYPPVFLKDAAEYRMLVGSTFPPSSPFTVLLHCPLTCTVSKEKSAVIPIFVPPWVVFSLPPRFPLWFSAVCMWCLDGNSFACLFVVFNLLGA